MNKLVVVLSLILVLIIACLALSGLAVGVSGNAALLAQAQANRAMAEAFQTQAISSLLSQFLLAGLGMGALLVGLFLGQRLAANPKPELPVKSQSEPEREAWLPSGLSIPESQDEEAELWLSGWK